MLKRYLDHRGMSAKVSLALGYSPTADLLLPRERIEKRIYEKEENYVPFLFSPIFRQIEKHNEFGDIVETRKVIVGYSNTKPVYLDMTTAGGLWLFVSRTGAGKTFCLRGVIGDLIDAGYAVVAFDVKNEYISSLKPIQPKFYDILPPWRRPKALPVKPLFPAYLRKKGVPKEWVCQIDVKDMKVEDMLTALNLRQDDPQAQILLTVWREESVPKSIDNLIWRVSHVNASQILQKLLPKGAKLQPFAERTQSTLVRRLLLMKSQRVVGSDYPFDIVKMLREGYFPVICLDEDIGKKYYHSTYIAVLVRKIYEAYKYIGRRIVFVFEDAGSYAIPNRESPSCKTIILKQVIPVGRKRGIYCIGTIQNLSQINMEALNQVRAFIFFGVISGMDLEIIAKIRKKKASLVMNKIDELNQLVNIAKRKGLVPPDFRHVILWDDMDNAKVGFSTSPSSCHQEQEI
jgi:hypothetical protein